MADEERKDKALRLMERGFDLLDAYEYEKAVKVGKRIIDLRHTSGFEILALACERLGKKKKAIKTLEKGVRVAPKVWKLWQLLGNYYSDKGRYNKALSAYDEASACPYVDKNSVSFNRALVLTRQGKNEDAVNELSKVRHSKDESLCFRARSQKILLLQEIGQPATARRLAAALKKSLNELAEEVVWDDAREFAIVYSQLGEAFWKAERSTEALELAHQALHFKRGEKSALTLIRNVNNSYSEGARYFRLLVSGQWPEPLEEDNGKLRDMDFVSSYDVVADNKKEAREMIGALEPEEVAATLKVKESKVLEKRPSDPKGVYSMTGRMFYPRKKNVKK